MVFRFSNSIGKNKRTKQPVRVLPTNQKLLSARTQFSVTEAYKAARTNLLFTRKTEGCQKIVITSAFQSEGKTINCANMAVVLAQNDLRVLLIDADMRRPAVHKLFDMKQAIGLSELLAGIEPFSNLHALITPSAFQHLSILSSGNIPPNPAELLASPRMLELLNELAKDYDYILIDTPPICVVTDAAVVSKVVDGYLFVVRAEQTTMECVKTSITTLESVGASILGFVLNDINTKSSRNKYGSNRRYHKYEPSCEQGSS